MLSKSNKIHVEFGSVSDSERKVRDKRNYDLQFKIQANSLLAVAKKKDDDQDLLIQII